ncbi:3TM-type holin [Butyricimonas synergistica]|uniref:3TM-type holin n=1 Tax=Butyricimonas synergistica TaxID=544644 RepID=UPI00037341FF|nr:3TM-type holin [Butyricimonas synergistica]
MSGVSPIKNVADAVSGVVERLTLPAREKKQLEADLLRLLLEREQELIQAQAALLQEEGKGNWLQRSWRPLVMLTFAAVILMGTFTNISILSDTSRFWDLLEIGLGGYVVGRSGEKILTTLAKSRR